MIRAFLSVWLLFTIGGAAVAAAIWLLWPGEGGISVGASLAPPSVALLVWAASRLGVSSLGDDAHTVGYASRTLTRQHREGLGEEYSASRHEWLRKRIPGFAAVASLVTLWGIAAILYIAAGVE
ncbi:MAG: hypothetical protein ACLFO1_04665 [Spirochaetaceae bacterium]